MTSKDLFQLSSEFDDGDESQWRSLLEKALRGIDPASINTTTYDDLTIKALYRDTDWQSSTDQSGLPGLAPFIRGAAAKKDKYLPWDIRQIVSHPDPSEANKSILEDLENGVSSIEVRLDSEGGRGICVRTLSDFEKTLEDVKLDWAPIGLEVTGSSAGMGKAACAFLSTYAKSNADDVKSLQLAFNYDPISTLARTGHLLDNNESLRANLFDVVETLSTDFNNSTLLRADSRPVHEAGGSEAQELASLIASATYYVRTLVESGVSASKAASSINFTIAVGADYILEIAKLRAARRIWAKVASEFGVPESEFKMQIQAVSSRRMLTARDPWVNILRNTAACFAAGVGGADIATIRNFTDALGLPSRQARRIARNTHIIAQEESFLGKVMDPSGGTWSIASISDQMAQKAWSLFQDIERKGGYLQSLQDNDIQTQVKKIRSARLTDVAYRKVQITGVSDYPILQETAADFETPDVQTILSKAKPESGQAPQSTKLKDLSLATEQGFTLNDLSPETDTQIEADPFWPMRIAKPFERLRDFAEAFEAKNDISPSIFIAALGPLAGHTARTSFATNFFAAGGIKAEYHKGNAEELAGAFETSNAVLVCICGSDDRYLQEAADTARALGAAGAGRLYLAGKPPADVKGSWQEAGIDEFIHIGVDVVASLELAHSELGLSL